MKRIVLAVALAAALPAAAGLDGLGNLTQAQFRRVSEDLGAAMSYKGVTPATPLGITGFDIGVELTDTKVENPELFALAGVSGASHIYSPKIHLYKGLPAGLDIGAFVAAASDVDATYYGADLRWAFIQDSGALPAVAVRLSGTKATGLGPLDLSTFGADLMVSKVFVLATPYLGAGIVRVESEPKGTSLAAESFDASRVFGGVNLNLGVVNMAIEVDRTGDNASISAKVGWRF